MMKKSFVAVSILSLALVSVASAQGTVASAKSGDRYSRSQLKKMAQEARTPEQYATLASYYGYQQSVYRQQASEEMHELVRRRQTITPSLYAKHPILVDSVRNLYDYYNGKAANASTLFEKYSQLAAPASPAPQQQM